MANRILEPPGPRLFVFTPGIDLVQEPSQAYETWGDTDLNVLKIPAGDDPEDYLSDLRLDGYHGHADWRRVHILIWRGPQGQTEVIHLPPDDPFLKTLS